MCIQMIIDINDLSKVSETLFFFITHSTYMCKMANFLCYRKNMLKIEHVLNQSVFYFPENRMKILRKKVEATKRIMCFIAVVLMGFLPYLEDSKAMSLPLAGWQPYDATVFYYPTACFQIVTLSYTAANNVNFDCLFWMLMTLASGEFDILKENLKNIDCKKESRGIETEFINCVKHHEATERYVHKIESTFSKGIFLNFLLSVGATCFTGFMMVLVPFLGLQFFFLALYLACMITEIAGYCWCGHDVIVTSDEIGRSFYMSNWYESQLSLRKSIVIFLERTKKPVTLTGGKIVTLSLPTFTSVRTTADCYFLRDTKNVYFINSFEAGKINLMDSSVKIYYIYYFILRSSYSYFAVLQQIYDK